MLIERLRVLSKVCDARSDLKRFVSDVDEAIEALENKEETPPPAQELEE